MKTFILNWKMNPSTLEEAKNLFKDILDIAKAKKNIFSIICPSFVHLADCAHILGTSDPVNISLGAQNIGFIPNGALTGECSAQMLKDLSADYALIGHSERRYLVGEDTHKIKDRILNALAFGLVPVLFVGERERNDAWQDEIIDQVNEAIGELKQEQLSKIIFVYEPVWAISSNGKFADFDLEHTKEAGVFLKNIIAKLAGFINPDDIIILYGGSVNSDMIIELSSIKEYSGAVIGKASLNVESLSAIYNKVI